MYVLDSLLLTTMADLIMQVEQILKFEKPIPAKLTNIPVPLPTKIVKQRRESADQFTHNKGKPIVPTSK